MNMDARYRIAHAKEAAAKIRKNPKETEDIIAGVIAEEQSRIRRTLEAENARLREVLTKIGRVGDDGQCFTCLHYNCDDPECGGHAAREALTGSRDRKKEE